MSKLFVLITASLVMAAGSAAAQTPAPPAATPSNDNSPNGNVGRPGASSSSANTPSTGEPTGTNTPQIDKKADTSNNTAAAPTGR
jgi:hypothetical protein